MSLAKWILFFYSNSLTFEFVLSLFIHCWWYLACISKQNFTRHNGCRLHSSSHAHGKSHQAGRQAFIKKYKKKKKIFLNIFDICIWHYKCCTQSSFLKIFVVLLYVSFLFRYVHTIEKVHLIIQTFR